MKSQTELSEKRDGLDVCALNVKLFGMEVAYRGACHVYMHGHNVRCSLFRCGISRDESDEGVGKMGGCIAYIPSMTLNENMKHDRHNVLASIYRKTTSCPSPQYLLTDESTASTSLSNFPHSTSCFL